MAKDKVTPQDSRGISGKTRREMALEKKQANQMRRLRLGAMFVVGLIALIVIVGLIVEFVVTPNQAVAQIGNEEISLRDWQEMVRFQRAQLINSINEQYDQLLDTEAADQELAQQDALRFVQQFSAQQINALTFSYESLGEIVLDQMVDDVLVKQAAEERGITVSPEEVDEAIGAQYSFYNGDSPTPFPTATQGPEPTPSLTPITFGLEPGETPEPAAAVETPTPGPTPSPFPSPTPVSEEYFNEQFEGDMAALSDLGADPDIFRNLVELSLIRQALAEALFEEDDRETEVPHTSAYLLVFGDETSAAEQLAIINDTSYLDVWNTVRSIPPGTELENQVQATERLFWTEEQYGSSFPAEVAVAIRDLPVGEHSEVLAGVNAQTGETAYYIVAVSGREDRELDEFTIQRLQREGLTDFLNAERAARATVFENWRGRVPRQPLLPAFYTEPLPTITPPAPGPALPELELPTEGDGE